MSRHSSDELRDWRRDVCGKHGDLPSEPLDALSHAVVHAERAVRIAHDLNNMLTVITGYSQLLLHDLPQNDPNRLWLEQIDKTGERAAALATELLRSAQTSTKSR